MLSIRRLGFCCSWVFPSSGLSGNSAISPSTIEMVPVPSSVSDSCFFGVWSGYTCPTISRKTQYSVSFKDTLKAEPGIELPTYMDDFILSGFKLPPDCFIGSLFTQASSVCTLCSWRLFSLVTLAACMLEQPGVMKGWRISWWQEPTVDSGAGRA